MLTPFLFPTGDLALEAVLADATGLTLLVAPTGTQATCPLCQEPTTHRHSRYRRTLAAAPCATQAVRLELHARRFFCPTPTCPRRIFTERLPALAAPSARRTHRLTSLLQQIGLALGGTPGVRLAAPLGCITSARTLLRLVHQVPDPPTAPPRVVGIDDFAFRKGRTYGTILVDLETGEPLDLLPDRDAASVAAWLQAHPSVAIITRDRAEVYAQGATQGAPQAIQIADRWHLLKNLSETLDEILTRLYPELGQAVLTDPAEAADPSPAPVADPSPAPPATPPAETVLPADTTAPNIAVDTAPHAADSGSGSRVSPLQQQRRARRLALYEEVQARRAEGQSQRQLAEALGLALRTVQRFLQTDRFPERRPRAAAASALDPYKAYLRERWAAGGHNCARLGREVRERGYRGSYESVYAFLTNQHGSKAERSGKRATRARRAKTGYRVWRQRLSQPAATLTAEEQAAVEQVCAQNAEVRTVYELGQQFGQMVREQERTQLDGWLAAALSSGVAELARFARGLQQDYAAVAAALEWPWSNGPVEGHVNRLKVFKRMMYGRAGFALLRKRVLCAT